MSSALIWFVVGIACFGVEVLTPHFVLIFFGVGALAAALFSLIIPNTVAELILFSAVSLTSLLFLRSRLLNSLWGRSRSAIATDAVPGGQPGQSGQIGRTGTVSRAISVGKEGEIALGGSFWRAIADETIPEGTEVRVVAHAQDNEILLKVERIGEGSGNVTLLP